MNGNRQQATCCAEQVACYPQQVRVARNLLRWCKRGISLGLGLERFDLDNNTNN